MRQIEPSLTEETEQCLQEEERLHGDQVLPKLQEYDFLSEPKFCLSIRMSICISKPYLPFFQPSSAITNDPRVANPETGYDSMIHKPDVEDNTTHKT